MNAENARFIADNHKSKIIDEVIEEIKGAATNGLYYVYTYASIDSVSIEKLRDLGYAVEEIPDDFTKISSYKISW